MSLKKIFSLLVIFAFSNAIAANFDFGSDNTKSIGVTSLMSAATNNDVEGVKFFMHSDPVSINQKNFGGATALHLAARQGGFEVVDILVKAGAKIDAVDNEGWTPLMRAANASNPKIVKLLIDNGADATAKNSVGESAIINSLNSRCDECLAIILQGQNLATKMDEKILRQQLSDAYVIAQNHEDQKAQDMLSTYLNSIDKQVISEPIEHKPAVMVPVIASGAVATQQKKMPAQKPNQQKIVKFKFVQGDNSQGSEKKVLKEETLPLPIAQDVVKVLQDNPNVKPVDKISKRFIYNPTKDENAWNDKEEISLNDAPMVKKAVKKKNNYKLKSGKEKAAKPVVAAAPVLPAVAAPAVKPQAVVAPAAPAPIAAATKVVAAPAAAIPAAAPATQAQPAVKSVMLTPAAAPVAMPVPAAPNAPAKTTTTTTTTTTTSGK